ncbi:MAG: transmembrane 220 family protein [Verrucomicrobiaceae bacterium]
MKFLNYFLAALFVLFAWFQRNDIDPAIYHNPSSLDAFLWLIFYLIIGIAFILLTFRRLPRLYFTLAIVACFIEMASSGPGLWNNLFGDQPFTMTQVSMSADDPRVELTREFFGALIALAAVFFQLWQNTGKKSNS